MRNVNQRNRLVVFRVTQEEYDALKVACAGQGSRNLSDFTRNRLFSQRAPNSSPVTPGDRFLHIEQQLAALQTALQRFGGPPDDQISSNSPEPR
jgi:hypothetical protein